MAKENMSYIYTHTHTYIYIYIYIHTHIHIYIYIYTHTHRDTPWIEYYSAIENKIITFAATWIDLEIIILSEVNHKEKDKYHMITTYSIKK